MKRRFVKTSKEWRQRLLYAASAIASAFADYCINYIAIVLGLPMFFFSAELQDGIITTKLCAK